MADTDQILAAIQALRAEMESRFASLERVTHGIARRLLQAQECRDLGVDPGPPVPKATGGGSSPGMPIPLAAKSSSDD
jgi:hypothetical protein